MSSKKKTTQTNTYSHMTAPDTQDTIRLRELANQNQGPDPSIRYAFANARKDLDNSYQNPLGAYTSPAVRDAANRASSERLGMAQNVALQDSNRASQQQQFGQQSALAGLTAPQLVQTGGTTVQQQSMLPSILGAVAGVGSSALTAF